MDGSWNWTQGRFKVSTLSALLDKGFYRTPTMYISHTSSLSAFYLPSRKPKIAKRARDIYVIGKHKMKHLLIILSALCLISCNKRGNDLYGVWYAIDTLHPESNYVERHITDSAISIVNNVNFSYFTKYDYDNNILEEYPLDPYDLSKILDTLTFQVEIKEGSMILTNMINSKVKSSWKKVENVEPFDIINDDSFKSFLPEFRKRYLNNYLNSNRPNSLDEYLMYFDENWELNE